MSLWKDDRFADSCWEMDHFEPHGPRFEAELLRVARTAIVVCRADRIVTYASAHAVRLFGCELLGQDIASLVSPVAADALISYLARLSAAESDVAAYCETRVIGDGERVVEAVGVNRLADGSIQGIVLSISDITEHHHRAAALGRQATTDALTGLPNRTVFGDRLGEAIRAGRGGVLAMLDVDAFKQINDRFGHQMGDAVLIELGRRMRDALAECDRATVARLGGDEFAVLLPETSVDQAGAIIDAVQRAIEVPRQIGGVEVVVTASAGLAELASSATATLRAADMAMYAAKQDRRNRVVYTPELAVERRRLADRLEALQRQNHALHVEARTDALTGLANRRRYDEDLAALDLAAAQGACVFSVIAIDIDHFGQVNKTGGGQDSGDATLRRVAQAFASAIRDADILYRRGGEEFVVLLPDADLADARAVAERIRATLKREDIPHPHQKRVTVSMGIATFDQTAHADSAAVISAADAAMQYAKHNGRNRVVVDERSLRTNDPA